MFDLSTFVHPFDLYHGGMPYDFFYADCRSFHCMLYDPTGNDCHWDCYFDEVGDGECANKCEWCSEYGDGIVSTYVQSTLCQRCGFKYFEELKDDPNYVFDSEDEYHFGEFMSDSD